MMSAVEAPAWRRHIVVSEETTRLFDRLAVQGWADEEVIVVARDLISALQLTSVAAFAGEPERALTHLAEAERALLAARLALPMRRRTQGRPS